jgi:hypothetical protein
MEEDMGGIMPISEQKRRLRKSKQAERDSGRWLLDNDGPDPIWQNVSSSTGRVGHITQLQFDVVSRNYAGEVKNIIVPARLFGFWLKIVSIASSHGKNPVLIIVPNNEHKQVGVPKKAPSLHIITEERHAELLRKERLADGISSASE